MSFLYFFSKFELNSVLIATIAGKTRRLCQPNLNSVYVLTLINQREMIIRERDNKA